MTKLFQIVELKPSEVKVNERARKDLGDVKALAQTIKSQGQLNPILITPDNVLIAGERRLRAIKSLKSTTILCRIMPDLSTEDLLFIEHMENESRKDFTWHEELMLRYSMHNHWVEQGKKADPPISWTFKDSAKKLSCSVGGLSSDLTLAAGIKVFPNLINCTSKGQAREAYKKMAEQAAAFKKMDSLSDTEKDKMKSLMSGSAIKKTKAKKSAPLIQAKHDDDISDLIEHQTSDEKSTPDRSTVEPRDESLKQEEPEFTEEVIENEEDLPSYVVEDLFTFVPQLPDESVGFIELDPPYAISYNENYQQKNEEVQTKVDWTPEDLITFYETMFPIYYSKLMPNSWLLCWIGKEWYKACNMIAQEAGFKTQPFGVWVKSGGSVNRPSTTMISMFECFMLLRKGNATFNTKSFPSVISCPTTSGSAKTHQWEKPIQLYDIFFNACARPKTVFHSSFAGSGNCLISAKKVDMIPIGCDTSEKDAHQFYYKYKKHFMEI